MKTFLNCKYVEKISKAKQFRKTSLFLYRFKLKEGFALIELLVVIAVLGLLASIILVALNGARAKARDAKRLADFKQFTTGLELYYNLYGIYPCGDATWSPGIMVDSSISYPFLNGGNIPACTNGPTFGLKDAGIISQDMPKDPVNVIGKNTYVYQVNESRTSYVLYTYLETQPVTMSKDGGHCGKLYEIGVGVGSADPNLYPQVMFTFPEGCN